MTEHHDATYARRAIRLVFGFMALTVPFGIFLLTQSYGDESDKHLTTAGWACFGLFSLCIVVAVALVTHPSKRHRCQICRRVTQAIPLDQTPKREHRFHCPDCDVVWTTGVYDES